MVPSESPSLKGKLDAQSKEKNVSAESPLKKNQRHRDDNNLASKQFSNQFSKLNIHGSRLNKTRAVTVIVLSDSEGFVGLGDTSLKGVCFSKRL